ncbi:MAG: zf-HC2 domain-containing protein [Thermodesulfobacteriota bacterium]
MLTCREASKGISMSMDRKLPVHHRIGLLLHLAICKYCRRFRKQLHIIRDLFAGREDLYLQAVPAEGLSRDAADRIKNRLKAYVE